MLGTMWGEQIKNKSRLFIFRLITNTSPEFLVINS